MASDVPLNGLNAPLRNHCFAQKIFGALSTSLYLFCNKIMCNTKSGLALNITKFITWLDIGLTTTCFHFHFIFSQSSHNWNTLFISANAVADVMAAKYQTSKSEVLDAVSLVLVWSIKDSVSDGCIMFYQACLDQIINFVLFKFCNIRVKKKKTLIY